MSLENCLFFDSKDGISMDVIGDKSGNLLSLPLRCHMSSAMDGCELEVVVVDVVT
jgi:hypothetical protein